MTQITDKSMVATQNNSKVLKCFKGKFVPTQLLGTCHKKNSGKSKTHSRFVFVLQIATSSWPTPEWSGTQSSIAMTVSAR